VVGAFTSQRERSFGWCDLALLMSELGTLYLGFWYQAQAFSSTIVIVDTL
jgi:hypothetical protein